MSIVNDARGPASRECYDGLGCALNNRPGLIFVTPRGSTTGGIGCLLEGQDTPPHLPCVANQLGAVEIGMGKCSLHSRSFIGKTPDSRRESKVEEVWGGRG